LTGWTSFVAGFAGAIAANAFFLAFYLGRFIPAAKDDTPLLVIPVPLVPLTISRQSIIAISAIVLLAWVHLRGVGPGRLVMNVLAVLKVSALLVFIALGLSLGAGSSANLTNSAGPVSAGAWMLALIPVMFAYSGWNAAAYVAEELREPGRNVPRALAVGTLAVIAIYFLLNALFLYVFPVDQLAKVQGSVLDVVADGLLGVQAGNIMGAVSVISLAASISAMTFAGPRVYYAMAQDGLFFRRAAEIHPRYRTPATAIVAQTVWACLLVLSGGANALTTYTGFAVILFAGVAVTSLFVLRQREPNAPRPFKAWGYPLAPGIFAIASIAIVLNALWKDLLVPLQTNAAWGPSAYGLIIIGLGIPLYYFFFLVTDKRS
jgi:APA family basic amino acid/polyamine antiporter